MWKVTERRLIRKIIKLERNKEKCSIYYREVRRILPQSETRHYEFHFISTRPSILVLTRPSPLSNISYLENWYRILLDKPDWLHFTSIPIFWISLLICYDISLQYNRCLFAVCWLDSFTNMIFTKLTVCFCFQIWRLLINRNNLLKR